MNTLNNSPQAPAGAALVEARNLSMRYGSKQVLDNLNFTLGKGRVVGLLGHNGAGKTTLMKAMVGLIEPEGALNVLGLSPRRDRTRMLQDVSYIPDVAVLPRWAKVEQLIELMQGLHPRFNAERALQLLRRTSVKPGDQVKKLSKGMVAQTHLALIAAIDAKLMILDEPTLGLDILSRKSFYEMLIDEWCDGERTVIISTHQVEEIESLLSDVMMLSEGKLVLNLPLEAIDNRYVAIRHDPAAAQTMANAHPLLRYRDQGMPTALFDGPPPPEIQALGQTVRPSLVDLFVALTRNPELNPASER